MKIGIIALQGDVSEHVSSLNFAIENVGVDAGVIEIRRPEQMDSLDALLIPGGESTTIAKQLKRFGLSEPIRNMAGTGKPIMGTCAGAVLLASGGDEEVERTGTKLLELMPYSVKRNSFGRQKDSFEADLEVAGFDSPFHAVFIRAPLITEVWGDTEVLARLNGDVVMVRSKNRLALSFHPELTEDTRIHALFLKMCLNTPSQP